MMQLNMTGCNSLRITNNKMGKSLERLSSALRINRAGDGPAELAVSQAMRADIIQIDRFKNNAQDGISLLQTAEGALAEVHNMLNRLVGLSGQAVNGIYVESDRESIQREVEQLKSEIDHIAESANFNGIPLLASGPIVPLSGEGKKEVFRVLSNVTGVEHKNPVQSGAVWEGEIDFSKVYDGTTMVIDGVTFEFNTDGTQNDSSAVNVSYSPGDSNGAASALETAISGSSLSGNLDICTVEGKGSGSIYKIKLNQKNSSAVNENGFDVSFGTSIPEVTHGTVEVDEIVPGIITVLNVNDIKIDTIADGTVIEFFGNKYEVDFDGILSGSYGGLDLRGTGTMQNRLESAISGLGLPGTVNVFAGAVGYYRIQFIYDPSYAAPAESDICFNTTTIPTPDLHVTQNKKGEVTPEVMPQNAARTDEIDFSLFQDGDSITIRGTTFEFDADGVLSDPSHAKVDVSNITNPSDMAAALKAAFDTRGITGLTMTTATLDSNRAKVRVDSDSAIEGENLELFYKVKKAEEGEDTEEAGLVLKVGSGDEGELHIKLVNMSTEALGISSISVNTAEDASKAMEASRKAVDKVSKYRGEIGAAQNRLERTINYLGVYRENLTASESRIADADMAKEMMDLVKLQIIEQSAHTMTAQSQNLMRSYVQQLLQV